MGISTAREFRKMTSRVFRNKNGNFEINFENGDFEKVVRNLNHGFFNVLYGFFNVTSYTVSLMSYTVSTTSYTDNEPPLVWT